MSKLMLEIVSDMASEMLLPSAPKSPRPKHLSITAHSASENFAQQTALTAVFADPEW